MPIVNWEKFASLPGAPTTNFEMLCRALIRRHYAQYGEFKALANQAGIEFDLKLNLPCDLGQPGRWYGWQCRWYDLPSGKALGVTRRKKIEEAIRNTLSELPLLTDWVLWTRHTLTKADQAWFYDIKTNFNLILKTSIDLEELLAGPGAILRETYFGELVFDPMALGELHRQAIAPFSTRWKPEVHHVVQGERHLRYWLAAPEDWVSMSDIQSRLRNDIEIVSKDAASVSTVLQVSITGLVEHALSIAERLRATHDALQLGDLEKVRLLLNISETPPKSFRNLLHKLRGARSPVALSATNLLADVHAAHADLASLARSLTVSSVAVVAAAGNGKTEIAIQLTLPFHGRPAGILLLGRDLRAGQNLDDLARRVNVFGNAISSFERLVEAVDAAGQRAGRRIPIVIDGLNESEDPRDWKAALASAEVVLARYAYVLLVFTLRSEFVSECIPDATRTIELTGFQEDTYEAIERYFEYYKIDSTDADLPLELLVHPLTLRMYCEVTNSRRERWVGVEAMPGSLTVLFEKYLDIVAARISELSPARHRIIPDEIRSALATIGGLLWTKNVRSIGFDDLRVELGDDRREWQASIVRSLESEGLLIRTTEEGRRKFGVAVVYDLLAGHLIADYLFENELNNDVDRWFQQPSNIARLSQGTDQSHTLCSDAFRALGGLFPIRRFRRQLWPLLQGPMRTKALGLATYLDAGHINRETVEELERMMRTSSSVAHFLFHRVKVTRAAQAHPLDCNFLDAFLRAISNSERDLVWTEWLRKNEQSIKEDIEEMEARWLKGQLSKSHDSLRAKWVMWTLTTTSRQLRDYGTRALHTFCRLMPKEFFDLALESLTVADPYVPERMLAAAYGSALSVWSAPDGAAFRSALPPLAAELTKRMFLPGAPSPTRHTLMREFALGLISIAQKIAPDCIVANHLPFLLSPFDHLPSPFDGYENSTDDELAAADDAIGMDFGNYTLGRLVLERSNYDFENLDYKSVRRAISFRMLALGYRSDTFEKAERDIGRSGSLYERQGLKTDRYGKKYAWIAYFEMWGWRHDHKLLPDWSLNERTSDVDLDPCFPRPPKKWSISTQDIFTSAPVIPNDWMGLGPSPAYERFFEMSEVDGVQGSWVLLDGFVKERNRSDDREVFTFLRGVLVAVEHAKRLTDIFTATQYPGNSAIPDEPERYYAFSGEMPFRSRPTWPPHAKDPETDDSQEAFVRHDGIQWRSGIPVEIPVQAYAWESYHSPLNNAGAVHIPSTSICEKFGLWCRNGEWDLHDGKGPASISRAITSSGDTVSGHLTYLRRDLLAKYLETTGKRLIWFPWGERGLHYRSGISRSEDLRPVYVVHGHVHKKFVVWASERVDTTKRKRAVRPKTV